MSDRQARGSDAPTIPLYSRASDIRTMVLNQGCDGQLLLRWLYDGELPDAVWFILGTAAHTAYEQAILEDLDLDATLDVAHQDKKMMRLMAKEHGIIESGSKRAKRSLDTLDDDLTLVVTNWWQNVMPDGERRYKKLDEYDWPPLVEHNIVVKPRGRAGNLYTQVDAIFRHSEQKFGEETLIVDWKTGSTAKSHESQLHVYAYGGNKEGWRPPHQWLVGAFFHAAAEKWQWVPDYVGDEVVETWIRRTHQAKIDTLEIGPVYAPDWWCNYCTSRSVCPVMGDGSNEDIELRLTSAQTIDQPQEED